MFFPLFTFVIASILPAGKFALHVGDVYEWSRQDLLTVTETSTRVTVLDSGISDSLPVDSGKVWRLKIEPASAMPETLQLFEFKNGAKRWLRGSANFPVELDPPPSSAALCNRGGLFWGIPDLLSKIEMLRHPGGNNTPWDTSLQYNSNLTNGRWSAGIYLRTMASWYEKVWRIYDSASITGIWNDSLGPIWFSGRFDQNYRGIIDWSLIAVNGKKISTIHPRLDSVKAVLSEMSVRAKRISYPAMNDSFSWKHYYSHKPRLEMNSKDVNSIIKAVVLESPPDSARWTRRTLQMMERFENDSMASWNAVCRWDSLGIGLCEGGKYDLITYGWSISRNDVLMGDTTYKRVTDNYNLDEYLATGLPLRGERFYRSEESCLGKGISCGVFAPEVKVSKWTLLSAPGYTLGVTLRPAPSVRNKLNAVTLRALLSKEPSAQVKWSTVSGRSGQQPLAEFMAKRLSGAMWLQVTTTSGRKLEGILLGL